MASAFKIPESLKRKELQKLTRTERQKIETGGLFNSKNLSKNPFSIRNESSYGRAEFENERTTASAFSIDDEDMITSKKAKTNECVFGSFALKSQRSSQATGRTKINQKGKTVPNNKTTRLSKRRSSSTNRSPVIASHIRPLFGKAGTIGSAKSHRNNLNMPRKTIASALGWSLYDDIIMAQSTETVLTDKIERVRQPLLSKLEISAKLRELVGKKCTTDYEKYQLLEERDKILHKGRVKLTDVDTAQVAKGVCSDMCPEKERYIRQVQKLISQYECDSIGNMLPQKTVKDYSRSAADQDEPLPHDLRPCSVLLMTMDYLLSEIALETPNEDNDLVMWYDFLWSRTRAIRKDITQQMLIDQQAVDLIEKCTRLHIFASHRLCEFDLNEFNPKLNTENLTKCLQSLRHLYDDLAKRGIYCCNEAEFRAYDVMLNLTDSDILRQVLTYRSSIRQSKNVRLATALFAAVQNNNYVKFFRLVKHDADFLQLCICHRYFNDVRSTAFEILSRSLKGQYPVSDLTTLLGFDDYCDTVDFAKLYFIETKEDFCLLFDKTHCYMPGSPFPLKRSKWIDLRRLGKTLGEILNGNQLKSVVLPEPVCSFDSNGSYLHDPVLAPYMTEGQPYSFCHQSDITVEQLEQISTTGAGLIEEVSNGLCERIVKQTFLESVMKLFYQSLEGEIVSHLATDAFVCEKRKEWCRLREMEKKRLMDLTMIKGEDLFAELLQHLVEEITSRQLLRERCETKERCLNELADRLSNDMIAECIRSECSLMLNKLLVERQQKLQAVASRLDLLWLRQFTDKWRRAVTDGRKRKRAINRFPVAPLGDVHRSASLMSCGPRPRHLSSSARLDQYLQLNFVQRMDRLREIRQRNLIAKYFAQWMAYTASRRQTRALFESFPMRPGLNSFSLCTANDRRVSLPSQWTAEWQKYENVWNKDDECDRFPSVRETSLHSTSLPLDITIALSDIMQIESTNSQMSKYQYESKRDELVEKASIEQQNLSVELDNFKAKMASEARCINEDRKRFAEILFQK